LSRSVLKSTRLYTQSSEVTQKPGGKQESGYRNERGNLERKATATKGGKRSTIQTTLARKQGHWKNRSTKEEFDIEDNQGPAMSSLKDIMNALSVIDAPRTCVCGPAPKLLSLSGLVVKGVGHDISLPICECQVKLCWPLLLRSRRRTEEVWKRSSTRVYATPGRLTRAKGAHRESA
jgi:hypothetical protein